MGSYVCLSVFGGVLLFATVLNRYSKRGIEIMCKALRIGTVAIIGASIFICSVELNKYPLLNALDVFATKRFSYAHAALKIFGISFLGQRVYINEAERASVGISQNLFLDNAYMSILIRFGVVLFIIFCWGYLYNMYFQYKKGNYIMVIILFLYSVYGIIENGIYLMSYNFFLLSFADILFYKSKVKESIKPKLFFRRIISDK